MFQYGKIITMKKKLILSVAGLLAAGSITAVAFAANKNNAPKYNETPQTTTQQSNTSEIKVVPNTQSSPSTSPHLPTTTLSTNDTSYSASGAVPQTIPQTPLTAITVISTAYEINLNGTDMCVLNYSDGTKTKIPAIVTNEIDPNNPSTHNSNNNCASYLGQVKN